MNTSGTALAFVATLILVLTGNTLPSEMTKLQAEEYEQALGDVQLPRSYGVEVDRRLKQGLALLHHMTYDEARSEFEAAYQIDPKSSLALWGQAMSYIHPLWSDPPNEKQFDLGKGLISKAKAIETSSEREKVYIEAVEAYYKAGRNLDEIENLYAFEAGWKRAYERYPDDTECACFYALAHLASADPADKSYAKQRNAGDIARTVLRRNPEHPGAHLYSMYAYDYPELAHLALDLARAYSKIAPEIPHALHMPTHIFSQLGLWRDSIELNLRSAELALKHPVDDVISLHYLHALDYLVYAYLQIGDDLNAEKLQEHLSLINKTIQTHAASAYALAAIPARMALERRYWTSAADLFPRLPENFPWERFPAMEALTHFAIALGAAQYGDFSKATAAIHKLEELRDQAALSSRYWDDQVEILRLAARAWTTHQKGDRSIAMDFMQKAVTMEAASEKHPLTPGAVLPARELLADMHLDREEYKEALAEYRTCLTRNPGRFNSLFGAGRAAELSGDKDSASTYYQKLVDMASELSTRKELQIAKDFLES